jgi:hypothetical protein
MCVGAAPRRRSGVPFLVVMGLGPIQLTAHVSALRNTFPPFMAYPAGGAVPFAWCCGGR